MDFLLNRDDLHQCRFADSEAPEAGEGEALLRIESFGLTSNNITYAVLGEAMSYWKFFPAAGDDAKSWGRMPVWGFAEVEASGHDDLPAGTRVYGYLPPSTHLLVRPDRVSPLNFVDASPHRRELASAYQGYRRVEADPIHDRDQEAEQALFWPLFYTSFLIDDLLEDEEFFGAETVVISSASSKTALITAFLIAQRDAVELVALTSPGNAGLVERLDVYNRVVPYEEIESLPDDRTVYVDISGDAGIRATVHGHLRDSLAHSLTVGATHWERMSPDFVGAAEDLPGPEPSFFFAPVRIEKRGADWGTAELEARAAAAWPPFVEWTGGWLEVRRGEGPDELIKTYLDLLDGKIEPQVGHVLSLGGQSGS